MTQRIRVVANTVQIGTGSSAVFLGADSGVLRITDINANVVSLTPGEAVGGGGSGDVSNTYLTSTFTTNTAFQSALANTNLAIADRLQVANAITTLAGLTDVAQVTPTDGHILKYSSANTTYYFAAESGGGGSSTLASLTDVAQVTPTDGHVLKYSSANTTYYFAAESGGGGGDADYGLITGSVDSTADYGAIT
jgi:hypothetical protein